MRPLQSLLAAPNLQGQVLDLRPQVELHVSPARVVRVLAEDEAEWLLPPPIEVGVLQQEGVLGLSLGYQLVLPLLLGVLLVVTNFV